PLDPELLEPPLLEDEPLEFPPLDPELLEPPLLEDEPPEFPPELLAPEPLEPLLPLPPPLLPFSSSTSPEGSSWPFGPPFP
ncbi:MAG: hypothetical protein WBG86_15730, partial [Polyangiales bacterium]